SSDNSTSTSSWTPSLDFSTSSVVDVSSNTVNETGSSPTTDYTIVQTGHSTATDTSESNTSALSTSGHTATNTSSLHETGDEGTADSYAIDVTKSDGQNNTVISDGNTGDYTLSGSTGSTTTKIESNTHGSDHASFTEILTENVATLGEEGNEQAGQ